MKTLFEKISGKFSFFKHDNMVYILPTIAFMSEYPYYAYLDIMWFNWGISIELKNEKKQE